MFNGTCCLLCLECSEDQIDLIFKAENGLNARDIIELHFKEEVGKNGHCDLSDFDLFIMLRYLLTVGNDATDRKQSYLQDMLGID